MYYSKIRSDQVKVIIENFKKVIFYSIGSIVLTTLLATLFSFLKGINIMQTVFNTNYIVSTIIIAIGTVVFFIPVNLMSIRKIKKSNKMIYHSNIVDILKEEKELKISESLINICWGISHMILVGIVEIISLSL